MVQWEKQRVDVRGHPPKRYTISQFKAKKNLPNLLYECKTNTKHVCMCTVKNNSKCRSCHETLSERAQNERSEEGRGARKPRTSTERTAGMYCTSDPGVSRAGTYYRSQQIKTNPSHSAHERRGGAALTKVIRHCPTEAFHNLTVLSLDPDAINRLRPASSPPSSPHATPAPFARGLPAANPPPASDPVDPAVERVRSALSGAKATLSTTWVCSRSSCKHCPPCTLHTCTVPYVRAKAEQNVYGKKIEYERVGVETTAKKHDRNK